MSTLRSFVLGCVSDHSQEAVAATRSPRRLANAPFARPRTPRVKFGVPLTDTIKDDHLPAPLVDIMVYIAREGVTTTDLFRRNGNPTDTKLIMKRLVEGKEVVYSNYNFYTLASVIKKFLLKIPGGVFGSEVEQRLLDVLDLENRMQQYDSIHSIIASLPEASQQLISLLFGTWFRIVNHSEYNTMSSEAVAKSVAPSLFHTCADSLEQVEKAVRVLQILVDDFGVANMFGRKNIQYFADMTRTGINVREKYRYEFRYPADEAVPYEARLQELAQIIQTESKTRGFDPRHHAITEEEFYGSSPLAASRDRANTKGSQGSSGVAIHLPSSSSPPSPAQSLQPDDPDYNPHKKLTHVSSRSAPEVNQGCGSPTPDSTLTANKKIYLCTSLNRFDNVRRRQMLRLKKRSNWFLMHSPNTSCGSGESMALGGSHDASFTGKSSMEATWSDALASSDVTASDGGLSDSPQGLRVSSDIDCGYEEELSTPTSTVRSHQPVQRVAHMHKQQQDILNANHGQVASSPGRTSTNQADQTLSSAELSISLPLPTHTPHEPSLPVATNTPSNMPSTQGSLPVSETEVRFFMVENFYGGQNGDS